MKRPLLWNEILQGRNKKLQKSKIHKNIHYFYKFTNVEISIHCYEIVNIVGTWVEHLDRTINSQNASDLLEKQMRYFQAYATAYK